MAPATAIRTPYDVRVDHVKSIILSTTKLTDKAATDLAVNILSALNSIPEKIR